MTIRPAISTDISALLELLQTLFSIESDFDFDAQKSRRGLEMMLQNPEIRTVLVAEIEGEVAGMCSAQLVVSTAMGSVSAWIEDVVLKSEFRGQGVMPLLLGELEKWAISRGATRFQVLCDTANTPAMAFYPKTGFGQTNMVCFYKYPKGKDSE